MDKIALDLTDKEFVRVDFEGKYVFVKPFINVLDEATYIKKYVDTYFNEINFIDDYLEAEWTLMLSLIGEMTNFEIKENIKLNTLIDSGLWEVVKSNIKNYNDFREKLTIVIDHENKKRELDKSVGAILENISDKIMVFLDKVMEIDVSSDGTKKLVEELKSTMENFDNTFGQTPSGKTSRKAKVKSEKE